MAESGCRPVVCFRPVTGWRGPVLESGKRGLVFKIGSAEPSLVHLPEKVPCGVCCGCRLERSRQWAKRCLDEASLWKRNCFITLTFDTAHLPEGGQLSVVPFQLFMKRLRKHAKGVRIRFYHCGEYGEKHGRPHYHACLFNWDFADKKLWTVRDGVKLYRSARLEQLWCDPKTKQCLGFATVGEVTWESAAYVARYVMKKLGGKHPAAGYFLDKRTGELKAPEYTTMSRGGRGGLGGIGTGWYRKFKADIFPHDYAIVRGKKMRPPKFYDGLYEIDDPSDMRRIKVARRARADKMEPVYNKVLGRWQSLPVCRDDRLSVMEELTNSRIERLVRPLED